MHRRGEESDQQDGIQKVAAILRLAVQEEGVGRITEKIWTRGFSTAVLIF